jgi:predicted amidophosphoribosyltransferase
MGENSNYPMGVNGSHPYFNQPDAPECPKCVADIEPDWEFCPYCGTHIDWAEIRGEEWWRCS